MEIYPLDILIHIINIIVLFVLLRLILFKPVKKFMNERTSRIQKQMDDAAAAQSAAAAQKEEYDKKLEYANEHTRQLIKEGEHTAMEQSDVIIAAANEKAERIIAEAREKAEAEKKAALGNMQDEIADIAVDIAGKILRREVTKDDNMQAVSDFFKEVK